MPQEVIQITIPEELRSQLEELGIDISEAILAYLKGLAERARRLRVLKSIEERVASLVGQELPAGTVERFLREDREHGH